MQNVSHPRSPTYMFPSVKPWGEVKPWWEVNIEIKIDGKE